MRLIINVHFLSPSSLTLFTGRALQRAAATAAVERARRARIAQGGAAKGGGGKGKGVEEREEECSICQSEFTVRGDGGECSAIGIYHWKRDDTILYVSFI